MDRNAIFAKVKEYILQQLPVDEAKIVDSARMIEDLGADSAVLRGIAKTAGAEDLQKLRASLEGKAARILPVMTQLGGMKSEDTLESGFLI